MIKRTISLLLCLVLMFTLFAGCDTPDTSSTDIVSSEPDSSSEPQDTTSSLEEAISSQTDKKTGISVPATVDKTFETLPAEYSVLLNKNPDRGFRSEDMYFVPVIDTLRANPEDYTYEKLLAKVKSNINANIGESVMVSRVYFRMSNYKDIPELPQEVYSYIDNVCKAYAEVGVKMYWEAYYQQGSYPDQGARKSVILKHLDTYGKIWEKHKDTIYAVCFGLIGGYGEWTTIGDNLYDDGIDPTLYTYEERQAMILEGKRQVAAKVLSLLPEQTYLTMRRPSQKAEAVPADHPKYDMIGFAQDAFFGKMFPSEDYGQGGWQPDNSGGWWEMSIKESPYVPNDGELYTTRYFKDNGIYVEPYSSIQVFSELHETTFSVNHGYADFSTFNATLTETVLYGWKCEEITAAKLRELGVLYSPGWFIDEDGNTVQRNVFEYVRDYLGYRLSARTLKVTGGTKAGESIKLNMTLRNYGFSAAFNLRSGFAILDENNDIVSEVYAGDPTSWHPTDPENYSDRTQLTHTVTASLKLPKESGTYKIAFFMRNNLGQTARLDNSVEYSDGFNILHMFTID